MIHAASGGSTATSSAPGLVPIWNDSCDSEMPRASACVASENTVATATNAIATPPARSWTHRHQPL
jgi:hypothetical protein